MVRYVDLSSTLRKLGALVCKTDPCFWRVLSADGETLGVLGIHVDDILLAGDEIRLEWVEFVHRLHGSYQWAPWETDQFSQYCGVGLQQLYDDSIVLSHEEYCANISQVETRRTGGQRCGQWGGFGKVNVVGWKSCRLQRVARSSLAAESQALADLEQESMFARLTWAELLGHQVNLENTVPFLTKIPAVLITDARALFDALEKGSIASSGYSMKDKYERCKLCLNSTVLQWVDSQTTSSPTD